MDKGIGGVIVLESIRNGEVEFRIETRESVVIRAERTSDGTPQIGVSLGGSYVQVRNAEWLNVTETPERNDA
jgi:hypothetical protein